MHSAPFKGRPGDQFDHLGHRQEDRPRGQKPTYFVRDALENLRNALVAEVEKQLARATREGRDE
jgi:hypothetical protein